MERFFSCRIPKRNIQSLIVSLPHDDKAMARKTIARKNKVEQKDVKKLCIMEKGFRL